MWGSATVPVATPCVSRGVPCRVAVPKRLCENSPRSNAGKGEVLNPEGTAESASSASLFQPNATIRLKTKITAMQFGKRRKSATRAAKNYMTISLTPFSLDHNLFTWSEYPNDSGESR
jgi:hypothetical protein